MWVVGGGWQTRPPRRIYLWGGSWVRGLGASGLSKTGFTSRGEANHGFGQTQCRISGGGSCQGVPPPKCSQKSEHFGGPPPHLSPAQV